jgi:threonine dehydrogenase-like Zn-dependent dehydrogenase
MKAFLADAEWAPRNTETLSDDEVARKRAFNGNQVWKNPCITITDVPSPAVGRDDLLIKVAYCGICGSDTHTYETDNEGYIVFSGLAKLPCILGHEFTGEVVETGSEVLGFKKGDIITSESVMWCGKCVPCRTGMPNQCENVELMGLSVDGAFAELISVNAKYCWKLNALEDRLAREDVLKLGTLIEPIGCAYNGIFVSGGGFLPGSYAIVYGAGPIGLGAVLLLKAAGAAKIIAVDVVGERLEIAEKLGADHIINARKEGQPEKIIMQLTTGRGAEIQVEAAGAAHMTMPLMQRACSKRGKIIYLGRVDASVQVELNRIVSGAHSIVGSRGHSGYGIYPNIISLLQNGRLGAAKEMITSVVPFSRIQDGFAASANRTDGKILIEMR